MLALGIVENLKASSGQAHETTMPARTLPPFLPVLSRLYQLTEYGLGQFADLGFPRDRGLPYLGKSLWRSGHFCLAALRRS